MKYEFNDHPIGLNSPKWGRGLYKAKGGQLKKRDRLPDLMEEKQRLDEEIARMIQDLANLSDRRSEIQNELLREWKPSRVRRLFKGKKI